MSLGLGRGLGIGPGVDPVYHARVRVLRHLRRHPGGVPADLMHAWIASVRRYGGLGARPEDRESNYNRALSELTRDGLVACTNGVWWARRRK